MLSILKDRSPAARSRVSVARAVRVNDDLLHPSVSEQILNINLEAGFLKFCCKSLLHFADVVLERNVNQTMNVRRQFHFALMKNCHALPTQTGQKHTKLQNNVLAGTIFLLVCAIASVSFVITIFRSARQKR